MPFYYFTLVIVPSFSLTILFFLINNVASHLIRLYIETSERQQIGEQNSIKITMQVVEDLLISVQRRKWHENI